jgi:hypothetical protein
LATSSFQDQYRAQIDKEMRRNNLAKCTPRGLRHGGTEQFSVLMLALPFIGFAGVAALFITLYINRDLRLGNIIVWTTFGVALAYGYIVSLYFLKPKVVLLWTLKAFMLLAILSGTIYMLLNF